MACEDKMVGGDQYWMKGEMDNSMFSSNLHSSCVLHSDCFFIQSAFFFAEFP